MATVKFSIGQVNITDFLLVQLYYQDAPTALVDEIVLAPDDLDDINNIVFDNILPKPVSVEARESPDGVDPGNLLSTFVIDVTNKLESIERRFYRVGGPRDIDPLPDTFDLTDPYFEGKKILGVFLEGYRYLYEWLPGADFDMQEWRRVGNSIQLIDSQNGEYGNSEGPKMHAGQVWVVDILFLQDQIVNEATEPAVAYEEITESIMLSAVHRRKWNVINGGATRIVLTAEALATLPDGEWFGFIVNGGNQYQTVFKCSESDTVIVNGLGRPAIYFGRSEKWKIYKRGSAYDILDGLENIAKVGNFVKTYSSSVLGALPCDGAERDGDDYPRIYEYIKNLPIGAAVNSQTLVYGKESQFHWYESGTAPNIVKKFRTPDKQNGIGRNLKSFSSRGADTSREYPIISNGTVVYLVNDQPGGRQWEQVGPHRHFIAVPSGTSNNPTFPNQRGGVMNKIRALLTYWTKSGGGAEGYYLDTSEAEPTGGRTSNGHVQRGATEDSCMSNNENRPTNFGEYEFVWV